MGGFNWFKTTLPEWQTSSAAVAELDKQGPQLQLTKVMVKAPNRGQASASRTMASQVR